MTDIKILSGITKPTIDGFEMPPCPLAGCDCAVRLRYPSGTRTSLHSKVGDTLTIGTIAQCNAGTKDVVQSVAEGFIAIGWAE